MGQTSPLSPSLSPAFLPPCLHWSCSSWTPPVYGASSPAGLRGDGKSHSVLHPSTLGGLQQLQKEKTPIKTSGMGCRCWQKCPGATGRCAAVLASRGVQSSPARGNFPLISRRQKQRGCCGEMEQKVVAAWGGGWLGLVPGDTRDGQRIPYSYWGSSAELHNPGASSLPCGFCCSRGGFATGRAL